MRLRRPPPRPHPETIVTLIDVVFFLLVFFMIIGRMDATAPFDVIPPRAVTGTDLPAGGLTVSVDDSGRLAIDGRILDEAEAIAKTRERLATDPGLMVRINADGTAPLRFVLPLVSAFEAAGARDVALIVTPNPQ